MFLKNLSTHLKFYDIIHIVRFFLFFGKNKKSLPTSQLTTTNPPPTNKIKPTNHHTLPQFPTFTPKTTQILPSLSTLPPKITKNQPTLSTNPQKPLLTLKFHKIIIKNPYKIKINITPQNPQIKKIHFSKIQKSQNSKI